MSITELRKEINKAINKASEPVLEEVLNYLKEMVNKPSEKVKLSKNLSTILQEDKKLLQKLAE
jgi:hypothetical protein